MWQCQVTYRVMEIHLPTNGGQCVVVGMIIQEGLRGKRCEPITLAGRKAMTNKSKRGQPTRAD